MREIWGRICYTDFSELKEYEVLACFSNGENIEQQQNINCCLSRLTCDWYMILISKSDLSKCLSRYQISFLTNKKQNKKKRKTTKNPTVTHFQMTKYLWPFDLCIEGKKGRRGERMGFWGTKHKMKHTRDISDPFPLMWTTLAVERQILLFSPHVYNQSSVSTLFSSLNLYLA